MIAYYLKTALKTFGKYRMHSLISLVSLTAGFCCFIAASVTVNYYRSWDTHFPDAERIYSVNGSTPQPRTDGMPGVPKRLAPYLESQFPEIEHISVETLGTRELAVTTIEATENLRIKFIGGDFLHLFPLALVEPGGVATQLPPNTVLIDEAVALARFGTTDVVGRRLVVARKVELTVHGVIKTTERPTHLDAVHAGTVNPDLIAPLEVAERIVGAGNEDLERWNSKSYALYVKFAAGLPLDVAALNRRLVQFSEEFVEPNYYRTGPHLTTFSFHPLREYGISMLRILFGSADAARLIYFAGFLVLFIACLNYSNLVIAQLTQRRHEITVQKVVGAKRTQLLAQFGLESLIMAGAALLIALAICACVIANTDLLRAKGVHPGLLLNATLWLTSLTGLASIVAIAGLYPALRISRGSLSTMLHPGSSAAYSHRLRSLMVGVQFVFSSALLILAIFVFNQNDTMVRQAGNELDRPTMILRGSNEQGGELDLLEAELRRDSSIVTTSRTELVPWDGGVEAVPLSRTADPLGGWIPLFGYTVGYDYFEAMDIPLLAGRAFSRDYASDVYPLPEEIPEAQGPYSVVIDEATARRLGWSSPAEAVGEPLYTFYTPPVVDEIRSVALTVIGIVGNRALELGAIGHPATHMFTLNPSLAGHLIVRPESDDVPAALAHIDRVWAGFYPLSPANPEFIDDIFAQSYSVIRVIGNVFAVLAAFSFGISSIGLIGMATFVSRLRQREVGIRKIMGARAKQVLKMLLMDFSRPVLIANLIAWPLGFVLASAYLSIFTVRTPVTVGPFAVSLIIALAVAVVAIGAQAYRSSQVRPASVLKYE